MKYSFHFTRAKSPVYISELIGSMQEELGNLNFAEDPECLDDGALFRVTIERVGVVRTTKEVERDGEG